MYNSTQEGANAYRWWADWIPTPQGQQWVNGKRHEARRVVDGMVHKWGLQALRSGEGVVDVGGDPGFVAAELLRSGVHVTVIDPAFGYAGKSDAATTEYLSDPQHRYSVRPGVTPFRLLRRPFNQAFVEDPSNAQLLQGASAFVSLYPDEATNFLVAFTASRALRTALIPCNECAQYFPPHEPTYEGFVKQILVSDQYQVKLYGQGSYLRREQLWDTPFCNTLLQRSPVEPIPRPLPGPEGYAHPQHEASPPHADGLGHC